PAGDGTRHTAPTRAGRRPARPCPRSGPVQVCGGAQAPCPVRCNLSGDLGGGQATRGGGWCKPSPRRQAQRAAPTARRRQGWKPARGETGADRLDAQHDSPARKGDAQIDRSRGIRPTTDQLIFLGSK
ncbi:MAG: hypothetical protein B7X43_01100, partial [Thiomonas sp. 15-63-373]